MRLLVTGGAGFIGSNFIRYWLGRDPSGSVLNLDLLTYAGDLASLSDVARDAGDRYRFVRGDIADAALARELLATHRPDAIVNFAAESHNSRGVLDPGAFVRTNVLGTQILLQAARQAGTRFHHVSTCEVYGDLALDSADAFTEGSPYRPRTPYSASKAAADLFVRAYGDAFLLPTTISNCSNNYGPYQHPEKVIPLFTTNALEGGELPVYRNSEHRREWLHVEDHCAAIALILERGRLGQTYNIGSGEERTVDQVADTVLAALDLQRDLKTYVEDRPGHDRRYLLDHSKITDELGWRPTIRFDDGIRETVRWYRDHPGWWRGKKEAAAQAVDERGWSRAALMR